MPLNPDDKEQLSNVLNIAFSKREQVEKLYEEKFQLSPKTSPKPRNDYPGTLYLDHFNQRNKSLDQKINEQVTEAKMETEPFIQQMQPVVQDIARRTVEDVCYGDIHTPQEAHKAFEKQLLEKEKSMIDPEIPPDATPEQQHDLELAHSVEREFEGRWGAMEAKMPEMDMDAPQMEIDDDD